MVVVGWWWWWRWWLGKRVVEVVEGGGSGGGGWRWWPGGGGGRQATDRLRNYGQEGGRALTCYKTPTDTNTYLNTSTSIKCGQDKTFQKCNIL